MYLMGINSYFFILLITHTAKLYNCSVMCDSVHMQRQEPNSSTTLSVRLSSRVKSDLSRLAFATKRTKSYLAGEAIESFVERELEIVEGIKRGLADMRAGRVVPHDQVVAEMRQVIIAAKAKNKVGE